MPSLASQLASLTASDRDAALRLLDAAEADAVARSWRFWARPEQLAPPGDWAGWLILAGRGWGKTRTGAEWICDEVEAGRAKRIAIVAETSADGRDVLVEGDSGVMAVGHARRNAPRYEPSKRRLTWTNGAIATLYDAREPDQLRGPQHDLAWVDELAKYRYAERVWDQLQMGLRLGDHPRWCVTTTPRPIPLLRKLLVSPRVHITRGRTQDNLANLAPTFRETVVAAYRGTRLGRQELDAEILDDAPGALWSRRGLDEGRRDKAPRLTRVVVGLDPAASSEAGSDETGIIVAGVGEDGHGYVIDDLSGRYAPDQWARKAVAAYVGHNADALVYERNHGGEMIRSVIGSIPAQRALHLVPVWAAQGKRVRAEPIAALYEQGRVHHVGRLDTLENQMSTYTLDRDAEGSPDRVDALVWALSHLFPRMTEKVDHPTPAIAKAVWDPLRGSPATETDWDPLG